MKLDEILEQRDFIIEKAKKLGFVNPRIIKIDGDDKLNLLVDLDKKNENALIDNDGYLIALLKNQFKCDLEVMISDTIKPLYAETVKKVAGLESEDKIKEIFNVSNLQEIEFPALPALSEDDQENLTWIAEEAEKICNANTENTTSSSPIPFFTFSSNEDSANLTPTISPVPDKRARFFEILEEEGISLNEADSFIKEAKRRRTNTSEGQYSIPAH